MLTILTAVVLTALAAPPAGAPSPRERRAPSMNRTATGTFTVKYLPAPKGESPAGFHRLLLEKQFAGGLEGSSQLEMLASNAGDQPTGGYVALERFSGMLDGHRGTFVMQHSGTMSPGSMQISVVVTPGSGTGALAGMTGSLTIRVEGKQHFYELLYQLPE